mmetsp:Transcript_44903/g.108993  ORF Transcript_44903/g.108993 Transcript_44903/m.108993 type:complete len:340 (-) Transcript_44903:2702-3721(-)
MGVLTRLRSSRSSRNNPATNNNSNNDINNINVISIETPQRAMSELPLPPRGNTNSMVDTRDHRSFRNRKGKEVRRSATNSRRSFGSFFGRGGYKDSGKVQQQRRDPAAAEAAAATSKDYVAEEDTASSLDNPNNITRDSSLSSGPPPTVSSRISPPGNFRPSALQPKITEASNESATLAASMSHTYNNTGSTKPPPARTAAFKGPPRFDWIDIEYAAATKIQSIQRRNMVMSDLEARGYTTSAIRNAKRRRKASNRSYRQKMAAHEEVPAVFSCCAMGLAFGDATDPEPDDVAFREFQRKQYVEKHEQQAAYEDGLREQYYKSHGMLDSVAMLEEVEGH